jgi:hypothetical protein
MTEHDNGVPPGDSDQAPEQRRRSGRYDYPDEIRHGPRRGRRAAKRAYRAAERARTAEAFNAERTAAGPVRALAGIAALAILAGAAWLFGRAVDHSAPDPAAAAAATSATPTAAPAAPATPSGPPTPDSSLARADRTGPERVAGDWVRAYLTRDPLADQSHTAAVDRAAPWAVAALTANLAAYPDPAFDRLVSLGATATVTAVDVGRPAQGLPADTPLRVWRQAVAQITLASDERTSTETRTVQVELVSGNGGWLVSRVLGV